MIIFIFAELALHYFVNAIVKSTENKLPIITIIIILHTFLQQSLNSGFAQVRNLPAACWRIAMVRISEDGPVEIRLNTFRRSNIPQKQFTRLSDFHRMVTTVTKTSFCKIKPHSKDTFRRSLQTN